MLFTHSPTKIRRSYAPIPWFYWTVASVLQAVIRLGYTWKRYGDLPEVPPKYYSRAGVMYPSLIRKAPVLAVKHASMFDIFLTGLTMKRPMIWLGKASLFNHRALAVVLHALGAVPVIRRKDRTADPLPRIGLTGEQALSAMVEPLQRGFPAVVYIEGERADDVHLVSQVKMGAINLAMEARTTIVPVGLAGTTGKAHRSRIGRRKAVIVYGRAIDLEDYRKNSEYDVDKVRRDLHTAIQACTNQAWDHLGRN